jgi:hypothetical protein
LLRITTRVDLCGIQERVVGKIITHHYIDKMANYKLLVPHIEVAEGGHSADPDDAALRYGHSGVKAGKLDKRYPNNYIHTNRGVIWGTYTTYKRLLKQEPNATEFINLSKEMWLDILKRLYWDKILGDSIKSQPIAEILVEAAWGGGLSSMVLALQTWLNSKGANLVLDRKMGAKTRDAINKYVKTAKDEEELFSKLTQQRMSYLRGLNTWWKHGKGWTDRVDKLAARAKDLFGDTTAQIGGGALLIAAIGGYFLYKKYFKT